MTKAQQTLREDIEKITDDAIIEKVRIFIKSFPTCRTIEIIVQSGKIDICDCLITVWRQRTMEQRVF